ncbi:MAG: FliM/FliN family flagellar motor switch protein, partial [Planctomycetaceae bacterium]
ERPRGRLPQLLKVPVDVSVRLAEKKVELEHLLMLTPGSLITFNKSCDDLLELYVNNCRYAIGEAVKIGENFGMKVIEVGVRPKREPRIVEG